MPSATLSFDLSTEQEEFHDAVKGTSYRAALGDLWNHLRTKLKYEDLTEVEHGCYDQVRDWVRNACEAYDLEVP